MDGLSDPLSPTLPSYSNVPASTYQQSIYEQSLQHTMSASSTTRAGFVLPQLQLGQSSLAPTPYPPQSPTSTQNALPPLRQTPLQRHLAHLARHGINGVSSAPGENGGSDSLSAESPRNSIVNVANAVHSSIGGQMSGASVVTSHIGSLGSFGSLRGRFSRFGSLSFGRRRNT